MLNVIICNFREGHFVAILFFIHSVHHRTTLKMKICIIFWRLLYWCRLTNAQHANICTRHQRVVPPLVKYIDLRRKIEINKMSHLMWNKWYSCCNDSAHWLKILIRFWTLTEHYEHWLKILNILIIDWKFWTDSEHFN
jgi:hypothetical protein